FSFLSRTSSISFLNFFLSPPSGFSSFTFVFLSTVFLDFGLVFLLSFLFSFLSFSFFLPGFTCSFISLLQADSLTSFLASADFCFFCPLFSVDEDVEPFFNLGVSLIALSVFGATVFVAEADFGLLAVAGLAVVALLAPVAAGFAALSVFGTAVFVAEVAFGLLAVTGLAVVALLAPVAAGFATLSAFGAAVFFAEAVFGLFAV